MPKRTCSRKSTSRVNSYRWRIAAGSQTVDHSCPGRCRCRRCRRPDRAKLARFPPPLTPVAMVLVLAVAVKRDTTPFAGVAVSLHLLTVPSVFWHHQQLVSSRWAREQLCRYSGGWRTAPRRKHRYIPVHPARLRLLEKACAASSAWRRHSYSECAGGSWVSERQERTWGTGGVLEHGHGWQGAICTLSKAPPAVRSLGW